MLEQLFKATVCNFTNNAELSNSLWREVTDHYNKKSRHYHTLSHLENLLTELTAVKSQITDWDAIIFAVVYHDIIYKSTAKDNEEKSAEVARKRLLQIGFLAKRIAKCVSMILATKGHSVSNDHDTNLFTDADLSVLGKSWGVYEEYAKNVRKEYKVYPDFLYKPGRKKVLEHFLGMEKIFKTEHFHKLYEERARENLKRESEWL